LIDNPCDASFLKQ